VKLEPELASTVESLLDALDGLRFAKETASPPRPCAAGNHG
jgi:hypothetical protein